MASQTQNGMQCTEFDVLLTEALDGTLSGTKLERFRAHASLCPVCGPLFAEVDAGRRLLNSLEEVEPPAHLVNNILAATSGFDTVHLHAGSTAARPSWLDTFRGRMAPIVASMFGVVRQPRFAMSFGMAFFSISLALNVAGVRMSDLRRLDLRPRAVQHAFNNASGRVVHYYQNIRFVYEIESRVREFKRVTTPAEPAPERNQHRKDNNTSEQPERRQERNYSQGENQPMLASTPDAPTVVPVTTTGRFV